MPRQHKFFPKYHRALTLETVSLKLNQQNEKRIRIDFQMLLDTNNLRQCPAFVGEAFAVVAKKDSGVGSAGIFEEVPNQKIDFFITDSHKKPELVVSGAQVRGLEVRRPEAEKNADSVYLYFHVNIPDSKVAWKWAYDNAGALVFALFEEEQMELDEQDDDEEKQLKM